MAIEGLKALQARAKAKAQEAADRDRPKVKYLSLGSKDMPDTVTVRFLQELDPEAANYNAERGVGVVEMEHSPANAFMKRATCTAMWVAEDGEADTRNCYACTEKKKDWKAWTTSEKFYINVLVDSGNGKPEVMILNRSFGSTFFQTLIQEHIDEGSITDANYRVTKTGEGTQTQWLLKRLKSEPLDDSDVKLFDIKKDVLREIPLDRQPEYYGVKSSTPEPSDDNLVKMQKPANSPVEDDGDEW